MRYQAHAENVHTFIKTGKSSPVFDTLEECIDWGCEHAQADDIGFCITEIIDVFLTTTSQTVSLTLTLAA